MNRALKIFVIGLVSFVVVGVASFFLAKAFAPNTTNPQALPQFDQPIPVVNAIPFEGDATEVATEYALYQRESLEAAYAAGLATNEPEPFMIEAAPVSTSAAGASSATASATVPTVPTLGEASTGVDDTEIDDAPSLPAPGGTSAAEERAVDLCAETDMDGCPEGVSGTVLAIRAVPELVGQTTFMPQGPDAARYVWDSRCEPTAPEEGKAYFGIATNRPAVITMRYRSLEWTRGEYAYPETTQTFTTSAADEAVWNEWLADDDAFDTDTRSWIHHCVTLELPPRDDYVAFVTYAAKEDASITAANRGRVDFWVPGPGGLEPGARRRPTFVLPSGIDALYVSATKEPSQRLQTVAIPGDDPALCEISGVESVIGRTAGSVRSQLISDTEIDGAVTEDPAYPYFPTYTSVISSRLDLRVGTDYVVCNYWLSPGPSFDPQQVVEVESILVATPEAWTPTVVLHGLTDIYRDPTSVTVSVPNCGSRTFDLLTEGAVVHDRTGARIASPFPETLCTVQGHLGEAARRGIRVDSTVTTGVGETQRTSHYIRTPIECRPGPCLAVRLPEMAIVPLASIASDGSECPSDPFTGCLTTDTHPAGRAIIELQFSSSDGNGAASWIIGEPTPYADTPPPLPERPQMDMDVSYTYASGGPSAGATAAVEIVTDRPVDLTVTGIVREPGAEGSCDLSEPAPPAAVTRLGTNTYRFTVTPLCLGSRYFVNVLAVDEDGNVGEFAGRIWGRSLDTPPDEAELFVPLAELRTETSVAVNAPVDEHGHTVYVHAASVRSGDAFGPLTRSLGWTWPIGDRRAQERDGWQLFGLDGRANDLCGEPGAGELNVHARRTPTGIPIMSTAYVGVQDNDVSLIVTVHENRTPGGPYGECAVGPLVAEYTLQRTVTVAELTEGIEITSDDGAVVWTLTGTPAGELDR